MSRGGLAAAIGAMSALAGCSLLLDFSGPLVDAGVPDADLSDAADTCALDEPNDELAGATPAMTATVLSSICGVGDHDFYGFVVDGSTDVIATLTFEGASGAEDLELILYNAIGGNEVTVSSGLDNDERIEHSAALANRLPAGTYALEVFGRADAVKNAYQLELVIESDPIDAGVPDATL